MSIMPYYAFYDILSYSACCRILCLLCHNKPTTCHIKPAKLQCPLWHTMPLRHNEQRWSRGHKARGQGHKKNPRPRTAFPRTDSFEAKDRNARGQGQGPRTQALVLSKEKRSLQKFFRRSQKKKKKRFHKNFSSDLHKETFSKKFFKRSTKF